MTSGASSDFGKEHGLVHEAVVTGRKVGAGREFWTTLAHDEQAFRRAVAAVGDEVPSAAAARFRVGMSSYDYWYVEDLDEKAPDHLQERIAVRCPEHLRGGAFIPGASKCNDCRAYAERVAAMLARGVVGFSFATEGSSQAMARLDQLADQMSATAHGTWDHERAELGKWARAAKVAESALRSAIGAHLFEFEYLPLLDDVFFDPLSGHLVKETHQRGRDDEWIGLGNENTFILDKGADVLIVALEKVVSRVLEGNVKVKLRVSREAVEQSLREAEEGIPYCRICTSYQCTNPEGHRRHQGRIQRDSLQVR